MTGLLARTAEAIASDLRGACRAVGLGGSCRFSEEPRTGLHTYRVERCGGHTRLHLRIHSDGTGVLFVDVTDALRLSETAARMAWLALEKASEEEALEVLRSSYEGADATELEEHYRRIAAMVDGLSDPSTSCRTCRLELPRTPLFSTPATAPFKVDLALTYACNNACSHCYNEPERFGLSLLSIDDWKRVIDRLAEAGVPHLIFTGGEPTLFPGLLELISHARERGQICGMNTNGRRLRDPSFARALADAGLDHVQVTLLSHEPERHDEMVGARAFHETVEGIEAAQAAGLHVITNTTLTGTTAPDVEETLHFLHGLGLRRFAMNAIIHAGGGQGNPEALPPDRLAAVLVQVRDLASRLDMAFLWYTVTRYCELSPLELEVGARRCNAAEYSMCIEPTGDVLPCQSYYRTAGNILRDPWDAFWMSELFMSFRDRNSAPIAAGLPESCSSCPDLCVCGGGCRLEREAGARPEADHRGERGDGSLVCRNGRGRGAAPRTA